MGVETAIIVGSAAYTMYNQYEQNKSQAKAARANAAGKEKLALETFDRADFNIGQIKKEALRFTGKQTAIAAANGLDVGGGNILMALEDTNQRLVEEIEIEKREANWRVAAIRSGASLDMQQARDIKKTNVPNLASTATQAYFQYRGANRNG